MRKAFTLVEIIVTLVITTIVIGVVSTAIFNSVKGFNAVSTTAKLQNEAVTLNSQYQELLKNATTSTILAAVPTTFIDGKKYIYSRSGQIFYRNGTLEPDIIFVTQNSQQEAIFTRINNQTISADFNLTQDTENYLLNTSTFMSNSTKITGTSGSCIEFTDVVVEVPKDYYLEEFKFEKSKNSAWNGGYGQDFTYYNSYNAFGRWSGLSTAPNAEYIGQIDHDKGSVDVYLPIYKPVKNNWEGFFITPTIKIGGDNVSHYTFNTTHSTAYKFTNADNVPGKMSGNAYDFSTTRQLSSSFFGLNQVFVHSKSGQIKMYTIYVHYKDPTFVESTFTGLTIIPTEKTVSPTTTDFNDTTNYTINPNTVMMPTEGHALNALFKTTADSYTVKWYAVSTQADVENFASKTDAEKAACVISTMNDKRTLDISTLVSTSKNPIGKYVFFSVESSGGTPVFSNATTNPFNLTNMINPHVYVQLDYAKMWDTTLNEVDYFYGGAFKVKTVENAYNLSAPFRNGYTSLTNGVREGYKDTTDFTFGSSTANSTLGVVSNTTYSEMMKSIKSDFLTNTLDFQYEVSLKDRTMRITGKRDRTIAMSEWWSQVVWDVSNKQNIMNYAHYSLLAINPYKTFYTDTQTIFSPSPGNTMTGLNISFKSPAKGVGGVSVNPMALPRYSIKTDLGFYEKFGSEGGRFDVVFNRSDASYAINNQSSYGPEKPGVKIVYGSPDGIFDRGTENDRAALAASNVARPSTTYVETPYTLEEINKNSGNFINPSGATDFTFQFLGNSVTTGVSGKLTALRLINNQNNNKSNLMFFGNIDGADSLYPSLFGSIFNKDKYTFSYNNGAGTAVVNGVTLDRTTPPDFGYGVYPSYDTFTSLFEPLGRPEVHISAWGYDSSMGPVDFSITGFRPILPSDLTY